MAATAGMAPRFWLGPPEGEIKSALAALAENLTAGGDVSGPLRALANQNRPVRDLERIASFAAKHGEALAGQGFECFALGVTSNASLKLIDGLLRGVAVGHGLLLELVFSEFGQALPLAMTPGDPFFAARFDAILNATFTPGLGLPLASFAAGEDGNELVDALAARMTREAEGLAAHGNCLVLCQSLTPEQQPVFGHNERRIPGTRAHGIATLNAHLEALAGGPNCDLIDMAQLTDRLGGDWFDRRNWNMARYPFTDPAAVLYADLLARRLAVIKGKTRRALILDLDNTLWGGVIGDDGLVGITLGQGSPEGEAYQALQHYARALSQRGVVLAVCSKNTEEIAREPFRDHAEMVLREEDIAVFVANWKDKAGNIRAIAETLSLGLDALVFVDDNPAERALVRQELPHVMVPEMGTDPGRYVDILSAGGFFEMPELSEADRARSAQYVANARRQDLAAQSSDMDSYLLSLEMRGTFRPFEGTDLKRIAQLINKTNQFNLTTRRRTEAEVQAILEGRDSRMGFSLRLLDRFGDNGLISVVIVDKTLPADAPQTEGAVYVDTWLMSCRVLGRQAEDFMIAQLAKTLSIRGFTHVIGHYIDTPRNGMVADLYPRLGFAPAGKPGFFRAETAPLAALSHTIECC